MTGGQKSKILNFSALERRKLHETLARYLSIDDKRMRAAIIRDIEKTGYLNVFAFGSLINDPYMSDCMSARDAVLRGYKASFDCYDIFYRGSRYKPGLTLGLKEEGGAKTQGIILQQSMLQDDKACPFRQVIKNLIAFAKRENPEKMPIYNFKLLDIEAEDGIIIKAIGCVANEKAICPEDGSGLYAGNMLSLEEKAKIIATAAADIRCCEDTKSAVNHLKGKRTAYQYLVNFIDARLKRGFEIEEDLYELLHKVNECRYEMGALKRSFLQEMEDLVHIDVRALMMQRVPLKVRRDRHIHKY